MVTSCPGWSVCEVKQKHWILLKYTPACSGSTLKLAVPVIYFVDPKALDDPNMKDVEQITLSYTFHRTKSGEDPASTL